LFSNIINAIEEFAILQKEHLMGLKGVCNTTKGAFKYHKCNRGVSSDIYFVVYNLYYVGQNCDLGIHTGPIHRDGGSIACAKIKWGIGSRSEGHKQV
jgi:hypothetical protein